MATIKGTKANDTRNGTASKDTINGLGGNDTLSGLGGADAINDNEGNDTLIGGLGADVLTGGAGADTFKYLLLSDSKAGIGFGIDTIRDFNAAVDVADLTALGTATLKSSYDASFTDLQAVFVYNVATNQTTLSYYDGSSIAVFQVKFTGNVTYSETAFLGIVEGASPPTPPSLSIDDVTVNEAAGTITFTVTRTGDLSGASSVNYNTGDDSAFAGSDYTAKSGTVNFASGEATQTIIVSITDDDDIESAETFKVTLSNPTGATISDSEGIGTINSDDVAPTPPSLSIDDVTVNEAAGTITFTVTRTGDLSGASSVSYNTGDDSAFAGSDYTAKSGTGDFASGEATQTITVSITDDDDIEDAETFKVTLNNPTNATISDSEGIGTINSDDVAPPPAPTENDDNLTGTAGVDNVDLLGGNDTYNALGGNDLIFGGTGNDTINGGDDNDGIVGGDGNDALNGGAGDDFLDGDAGNDILNGGAGDDVLDGGAGGDTLTGGSNGILFFGDQFDYDATTDSPYVIGAQLGAFNAAYDEIMDFEQGLDFISLGSIDSDGNIANGDTDFTFVPLGGTLDTVHGSVQVLPPQFGNTFYSVVVYLAGDSTPDMVIMVHSNVALTSSDFDL